MSRRIVLGGLAGLVVTLMIVGARGELFAQAPPVARAETADAAVAALVAEVRGLRADLAAAARSQLRAQMLLGRLQMQEQRLAYLDKQRSDAAGQAAAQAQALTLLREQVRGFDGGGCAKMPAEETRRDCEGMATMIKRQLTDQEAREQQLRVQESEFANALAAEQARWSDFNARLDELERAVR